MSKAIYAFSGDPITYGHIDIIRRAASVFDELIVAIGVNPEKKYLFSLEERTQLAQQALIKYSNVTVVSFTGLLIDFAYEIGADVIVKGVRNPTDFEYEVNLHKLGDSQKVGLDTFILVSRSELAHVSSSNVKQLQKDQGLIHEFVPLNVKQALEEKMGDQHIVTITGEIGSGKSYVSDKFVELGKENNIPVFHIDLDLVTHQIYQELKEPKYQQIRDMIADEFGNDVKNSDGSINRKVLGEVVFTDYKKLNRLNEIMHLPLLVRIRRELNGKKGLILLNAALLIESDMTYLSNNNVCLVKTNEDTQHKRLLKRNLNNEQIKRRLESQYSFDQKLESMEKIISRDSYGKIWIVDNTSESDSKSIKEQFMQICNFFQLC